FYINRTSGCCIRSRQNRGHKFRSAAVSVYDVEEEKGFYTRLLGVNRRARPERMSYYAEDCIMGDVAGTCVHGAL
ncbi:MAG: hypothetical protein R6U40_07160, partial [Desulfobacterales bacterium]